MKKAMTLVLMTALLCGSFLALAQDVQPTPVPAPKAAGPYTLEEAELLIYERIPGATLIRYGQDYDDGYLIYEGKASDDTYVYDFEIDAETGTFLEWDMSLIRRRAEATGEPGAPVSSESSELIGTAKAKEIALKQAGEGAQIVRIKLDYEDGRQVYEGKGYEGYFEFEFEIDALTGVILDWEWDD